MGISRAGSPERSHKITGVRYQTRHAKIMHYPSLRPQE